MPILTVSYVLPFLLLILHMHLKVKKKKSEHKTLSRIQIFSTEFHAFTDSSMCPKIQSQNLFETNSVKIHHVHLNHFTLFMT